jgi:hypothetical protein
MAVARGSAGAVQRVVEVSTGQRLKTRPPIGCVRSLRQVAETPQSTEGSRIDHPS